MLRRILVLVASLPGLTGCLSEAPGSVYLPFTIAAGEHGSTVPLGYLGGDTLAFSVIFDSSAVYYTRQPTNQADMNKLLGFSEDVHHHFNSARVG